MSGAGPSIEPGAVAVYRSFLESLNRHDLAGAERYVDVIAYREECVAFTPGFVTWDEAKASLQQVWKGIPDLRVEVTEIAGTDQLALAHGTARGTATGRLYGAPATRRSYEAGFFDMVHLTDGLITRRVQQAGVLGQMRQLYGKTMGLLGLAAMLRRL